MLSLLSVYINRGKTADVSHRMFSQQSAPIVSLPQQCNVEHTSVAPARFRASISTSFISNSTSILVPIQPLYCVSDKLVLDGHSSSPTMHSGINIGTWEEEKISLAAWESAIAGHIHWLEFLRFDSTGDPLWWIHRCECYFRARQTSENKRVTYATFHLLNVTQLSYHRLPGGPPTWKQFGSQFTIKPLSMPTLSGDTAAREGVADNSVPFKVAGEGDDALHLDDGSAERNTSNDDILALGKGDDALPVEGGLSLLSVYINKERAACVSHRVFSCLFPSSIPARLVRH
jgi:hypothetical protein